MPPSLFGALLTVWAVTLLLARRIIAATVLVAVGIVLLIFEVTVALTLTITLAIDLNLVEGDATALIKALPPIGLYPRITRPKGGDTIAPTLA